MNAAALAGVIAALCFGFTGLSVVVHVSRVLYRESLRNGFYWSRHDWSVWFPGTK